MRAGGGVRIQGGILRVKDEILRAESEHASVWHGIPCIDAEVQQDLVDLGDITDDRPQVVGENRAHLDMLHEGVVGDLADFLHHLADLDLLAPALDPAGEGKHLAHHVGPAACAAADQVDQFLAGGVREARLENIQRHQDRGEDVIQVMGDAAGQGADAFHALRTQEEALEQIALGDVTGNADHSNDRAGAIAVGCLGGGESPRHAGGGEHFLHGLRPVGFHHPMVIGLDGGCTFRAEDFLIIEAEELRHRPPGEIGERMIQQQIASFTVLDENRIGCAIGYRVEKIGRSPGGGFGELPLGDVLNLDDFMDRLAGCIPDQ